MKSNFPNCETVIHLRIKFSKDITHKHVFIKSLDYNTTKKIHINITTDKIDNFSDFDHSLSSTAFFIFQV